MQIKQILKKVFSVFIVFNLFLVSCNTNNIRKNLSENEFYDASNNILKIKENADELTVASVYAVSVPFFSALKMTDRIKAINTKSKFWKDIDRNIENADTVGRGTVDLEKLAKIRPDCLVHNAYDKTTVEAVQKLGIDVFCIKAENLDDIINTLGLMGKYFGKSKEADYIITYIKNKFDKIDNIVKSIKEEDKKTAILMGGTLGRIAGANALQSFMIERAGGICKIDESKNSNWVDIGVERIFEYNPDYLFITSSAVLDYDREELFKSPTWSGMAAIKNKNVFNMPAKIDSWDMPGISCVIGTMYILYKMYPTYFSRDELEKEIDEYYMMMFNRTFDKNYLGYTLD